MTKKAKNYTKKMVTDESKKQKKIRGKKNGVTVAVIQNHLTVKMNRGAEQMHMLASAGINPNNSDIEFEPDDKRRYRKQAKKWTKSRGKRRRC